MRFDIITVLPGLLDSPFAHSILQRAQKKGLAEIVVHNLRDYATNKQKSVDDYPYGGGSGMVMSIEPFAKCIEHLRSERTYDEIIFMTPDGETLNQSIANQLSIKGNIMVLCGHYKGIDQRIRDIFVTREKRVLGENGYEYNEVGHNNMLTRELEFKLKQELAKRREDRNIIDDFRVF